MTWHFLALKLICHLSSMVRPTMEYASSVWDPTNRKKIENLEKVQKRAARFVFNNYTEVVGSGGLFLGVIRMTWHFLALKLICHLSSQSARLCKSVRQSATPTPST
jgi:hypothetical protein